MAVTATAAVHGGALKAQRVHSVQPQGQPAAWDQCPRNVGLPMQSLLLRTAATRSSADVSNLATTASVSAMKQPCLAAQLQLTSINHHVMFGSCLQSGYNLAMTASTSCVEYRWYRGATEAMSTLVAVTFSSMTCFSVDRASSSASARVMSFL